MKELIKLWSQYMSIEGMSEEELNDAFYTDLEFGTGGMRGIVGIGTNRMNIYTIRNANYGYGQYLLKNSNKASVVIAYDNRHMSTEFAIESSKVLGSMGIKVYLFNKITPTPQLSYAIRELKATGGIVITASHNPPKYNGYKIYDSSGCQLIPSEANYVIEQIKNAPNPFETKYLSMDELIENKMVVYLDENIDNLYLEKVKQIQLNKDLDKSNFKLTFSALHGTSAYLGCRLLEECGYNFIKVQEQLVADPNFSTVSSPNPEDSKAFDLSIKYAKENNCNICIATDPDADRVGLAVLHNGEYILLNGNQTGALLINYLVKFKKVNKKGIVFNTIVTSNFGASIASKNNLEVKSTLTGFKFIGEQARLLENSNEYEFYFGYEESYGYVISDFVRDKDSLQALLMCSEMANYYALQGKTLIDVLNELYLEYGYHYDSLVNISLTGQSGQEKIKRILSHFRNKNTVDGVNIVCKEDYLTQTKLDLKTNSTSKLTLPVTEVIKFYLDDNSFFVLRPSGTEPKMKVYISVVSDNENSAIKRNEYLKKIVLDEVNKVE